MAEVSEDKVTLATLRRVSLALCGKSCAKRVQHGFYAPLFSFLHHSIAESITDCIAGLNFKYNSESQHLTLFTSATRLAARMLGDQFLAAISGRCIAETSKESSRHGFFLLQVFQTVRTPRLSGNKEFGGALTASLHFLLGLRAS